MEHSLKTWTAYYERIIESVKTFEVRKNDRDFQAGDRVILEEYFPSTGCYSGRCVIAVITYVFNGGQFGIEPGFCVFGFNITSIIDPPHKQVK